MVINMRPATSLNIFFDGSYRRPVEEQLRRTAEAGFELIDINFWDWGHQPASPFYGDGWKEWVKRIKDWGEANGVRYHQAHAMVFDPFSESEEQKLKAESARRALIAAGELGIDWVVFHPFAVKTDDRSLTLERNIDWLTPYVKLAGECGTGIALENMHDNAKNVRYCCGADELITLIDSFSSPTVGACWDIGHAHVQHIDQYKSITALGDRLKVLHVQDNDGIIDGHTAPFFGTVDWNTVITALKDCHYKGEFTFEAHMLIRNVPEDCKDAAAHLLYDIGKHCCAM